MFFQLCQTSIPTYVKQKGNKNEYQKRVPDTIGVPPTDHKSPVTKIGLKMDKMSFPTFQKGPKGCKITWGNQW